MNNILKIDTEVEIAYINILSSRLAGRIIETEELEENTDFEFDLDEQNRVRGIEIFGDTYEILKNMSNIDKFELKDGEYYWGKEQSCKTYDISYQGILLYFKNPDFTNFIGLSIIDTNKYPTKCLIG
ncbi:DUF2283 domain-containing protein [Rummeliibacillus sp. POC4]|uniref:DUF2283 domain-containing protein n=1 Tax=Rummeliibacillus sp. POC4 TaxID=2305899 RepID=UPI000E67187E|nr:DUF2283 domain-containing protein [Rummeliibacillus sp. POC4]RIJ66963.1 DUF2283 domain-containing protein [Rummeliibacillus sp. POC4]